MTDDQNSVVVPPVESAPAVAPAPNSHYPNQHGPYGYAPQPGQAPGGTYYPQPHISTLAVVSLILAFFVPLAGVICGHIALSQLKHTGEGGRGLALAGVIIGYALIALSIAIVIVYVIVIVSFIGAGGVSSFNNFNGINS